MHIFLKFKILNISKNSNFLFCRPCSLIILFVKKILISNQARESSPPIINCRPIITQLNFTNKRNVTERFTSCTVYRMLDWISTTLFEKFTFQDNPPNSADVIWHFIWDRCISLSDSRLSTCYLPAHLPGCGLKRDQIIFPNPESQLLHLLLRTQSTTNFSNCHN